MSFDTYLNNHMVAFACYKDGRENQNQNQKRPIHSLEQEKRTRMMYFDGAVVIVQAYTERLEED